MKLMEELRVWGIEQPVALIDDSGQRIDLEDPGGLFASIEAEDGL